MVVIDTSQIINAVKEHVVSAEKNGVYKDTCLEKYIESVKQADKTDGPGDQNSFNDSCDDKRMYLGPSPLEHLKIAKKYLSGLEKPLKCFEDGAHGDESFSFFENRRNAIETYGFVPESIHLAELFIYGGLAENADEVSTKVNYYMKAISAIENLIVQEDQIDDCIKAGVVEEMLIPDIIFDKKVTAYEISTVSKNLISNFISVASKNNKILPRAEVYLLAIDTFLSNNEAY